MMDPQQKGEIAWLFLKYCLYQLVAERVLRGEEETLQHVLGRRVGEIARAINVPPEELGAFLKQLFAGLPRSIFGS
ncbi:MAG: hypothetical protein HYS89_00245 [Candidatus Colwellbacteria bacterium]|nr:hypothetical protein [Candidatus Colwellbacteria bacterium]